MTSGKENAMNFACPRLYEYIFNVGMTSVFVEPEMEKKLEGKCNKK